MSLTDWLQQAIDFVANGMPPDSWLSNSFNIRALIVILIVSMICGAVGALVVSNRMAFFSDALAHCAFAGVGLGMLAALMLNRANDEPWLVPLIMVLFGILVGVAIAFVREKTGLASDTVIGVFFAFAVGFGGMIMQPLQARRTFNAEDFLWGSPLNARESDILIILVLGLILAYVLIRRYNQFVLASFNPSLARSRNVPLRWCNYLFVILLALIVNLCLRAVGALLINAMLIVPAATAANLSRNLRQMFWLSIGVSVCTGIAGLWLSNTVRIPIGRGNVLELGPAGTIVVLSVILFFATVVRQVMGGRTGRRSSLAVVGAVRENAIIAEPTSGRPA